MTRPHYFRIAVLIVCSVVLMSAAANGQVHSRIHPVPAVIKQVIPSFDNPEGAIFSADGRFVFITSAAELGRRVLTVSPGERVKPTSANSRCRRRVS